MPGALQLVKIDKQEHSITVKTDDVKLILCDEKYFKERYNYFGKQIKGFLGIGSAPEFLEHLMWKKFTKKMKSETIRDGIYNLKHGNYIYPITYQLIKDGRKNKVLNKKIYQDLNIVMIHGSKDKSVPVIYSRKILKIFKTNKKKIVIIKNGDHSLSSPKWLNILKKELKLIIN